MARAYGSVNLFTSLTYATPPTPMSTTPADGWVQNEDQGSVCSWAHESFMYSGKGWCGSHRGFWLKRAITRGDNDNNARVIGVV